jgi:hypothetical protein
MGRAQALSSAEQPLSKACRRPQSWPSVSPRLAPRASSSPQAIGATLKTTNAQRARDILRKLAAGTNGMTYHSAQTSKRVLVLGRSPQVNQGVVEPLRALGVRIQGSTDPDDAAKLFEARDFELIVFGRGIVGPLSERLTREFTAQNPDVRFIDAVAPVAVKQILSALQHDPRVPRYAADFRVVDDGFDCLVEANILRHCTAKLMVYYHPGTEALPAEPVDESEVNPGPFERRVAARRLKHAHSLLMILNDDEFRLHPISSPPRS